jgi:Zn-dependent protease
MNLETAIWLFPGLLIGVTVHEFAHAWSASLLGDDFARRQGRVSLNPLRHLSPLGTLMIFIAPFGWGRPVPVNLYNFKHPRRDYLLCSLAGPAANVIMVGLCLAIMQWTRYSFRFGDEGVSAMERAHLLLAFIAIINVVLATLNLIPIPPLDGSKIWSCIFPGVKPMQRPRTTWVFLIVLVALIYTDSLNPAIEFTVERARRLFPQSEAETFAKRWMDGTVALKTGQWAEAETSFTEALAVHAESPECLFGRAFARAQLGNWPGALDDMNQAIELRPDAEFYAYRATILRKLGRTAEAVADAATAEQLRQAAPEPEADGQ